MRILPTPTPYAAYPHSALIEQSQGGKDPECQSKPVLRSLVPQPLSCDSSCFYAFHRAVFPSVTAVSATNIPICECEAVSISWASVYVSVLHHINAMLIGNQRLYIDFRRSPVFHI